ncbi:MAG: type IV secretory system conjugative DNA transfer family protein [Candidatus Campbellbacteria bacterium]|nr:type IV secretory system conjugative DNA transfer family protein [Candidatus Campbellbacteria bacterium]
METFSLTPEKKFTTPNEEVNFLRERLKQLEKNVDAGTHELSHPTPEKEVIHTYAGHAPETVLAKGHEMLKPEIDAVVLDLAPEEHDTIIAELLSVMQEKGIRNALSIVEKMDNPHVEDDFHRFLSEYLKEGYITKGIKEGEPLWKALHMTLLEVTLPFDAKDAKEHQRPLKELLSSMEQLYAGALSVASEKGSKKKYFSIELAVEAHLEHVTLYMSVPTEKKDIFEKQLLSIFPQARVADRKNDYNIFFPEGKTAGSIAAYARPYMLPLKTHEHFDYDPLTILLSAFGKLLRVGEGAALQVLIRPAETDYADKIRKVIEKMAKGTPMKEALAEKSVVVSVGKEVHSFFFASKEKEDKKKEKERERPVDDITIEQLKQKFSQTIVETNIRLLASSTSQVRSDAILSELEATFSQLEDPRGNALKFTRFTKTKLTGLVKEFAFRLFSTDEILPMNLRELATFAHVPAVGSDSSRELKRAKAGGSPAPVDLPTEGLLLGENVYGNTKTPIYMTEGDRLRHFYCIGQTGTGKTTLLKNMIIQDIKNGEGVCMIDPHGTDLMEVLASVPQERFDDVIYFDPAYTARPMGLNMLEYDPAFPEQKTFVVNELFSIFQKLYGGVPESMGPMFEQYFRNATMLVIEDPDTGNTLFDVSRVMSEKAFRDLKLSRCKNPVVVQFWREVAEKAGGEASLANMVPYITSKFDIFLANDIMRPIVMQKHSAFNFRDIMDKRKILLVNLSKGRLGDINANLVGLIIVGKILMAALSRVDAVGKGDVPNFYLYIDEFQNITTNSIATILSEARKYKLGLSIFHQYIKQLDEKIKDAVFGNVGSMCSFRVGSDDAEFLEKQFAPVFTANDLMNVDNFNGFLKMLVRNKTERPFSIATMYPEKPDMTKVDTLKELSYAKFGRPREELEAGINAMYKI